MSSKNHGQNGDVLPFTSDVRSLERNQRLQSTNGHHARRLASNFTAGEDDTNQVRDSRGRMEVMPDEPRFSGYVLRWNGGSCIFGNTDQFQFMSLLLEYLDSFVSYEEIYSRIYGEIYDTTIDEPKERNSLRQLKGRVCKRLRDSGMGDLASAIRGSKQTYALIMSLPQVSLEQTRF